MRDTIESLCAHGSDAAILGIAKKNLNRLVDMANALGSGEIFLESTDMANPLCRCAEMI